MAHTNPEDFSAESTCRYRYLSSLIVDKILNNIASSSLPSSSTKPVESDAADSSIGQLVSGCGEDEATDTDKMVDDVKGLPVVKRVTFNDDVTIVSYEEASQGEDEKTNAQLVMMRMEDDGEKETVRIHKKKEDLLGSASGNGGDFTEKMSYCDADGNHLKRKCFASAWEDDCITPHKMIKPETLKSHQNKQDVNEDEVHAQANGSHFCDDKSKENVGAGKADVESILKVSESPESTVALTQYEEEHGTTPTANGVASISVCCPSDMDSVVQDNPIVLSLCQDDDDDNTDMNDSLPIKDIIDDCRSVLQSIVDNTLHQMVLNTNLDLNSENTADSDEQPPRKKIKPEPSSDSDTSESFLKFLSNSTVPGIQSKEEMEFSPNHIPHLADISTADVEQLPISETTDVNAGSMEAAVSCDDLSHDLCSENESGNGYSDQQVASDSTGVSTSTPDVLADGDRDGPKVTEAAEMSSSPDTPCTVRENMYSTSRDNLSREGSPSTPDVEVVEDVQNITPREDGTTSMEEADISLSPGTQSTVREHEYLSCNSNFSREGSPYPSTPDVEVVEDIQNITPRGESNAYLSVLAQDLYLDDSVECPDPPVKLGLHLNEDCVGGNWIPSSADVEVVKSDDVYVDVIEPSLREDIMPSPESSGEDFSCTFQKASQVVTTSQDETLCSHPLRKFDGLSPADINLEITTEDLQVPTVVSMEPVGEETMNYAVGGDWEAKLTSPDTDDSMSTVPVQDHLDIIQEPLKNLLPDIPERQFLQVLGLSPEQRMYKSPEQRKPCQSGPNEVLLTHVVESTKLSRIEAKATNDQTVPSLQTSVIDNPCIDQLLELEESIFSEQDIKSLEGPMKQIIPVLEEEPLIEDEEDKPIPDHLQTLGQHAAGVFRWSLSLSDPSLTLSPASDQSTLQCRANCPDQSTPITPVRPLPECPRRRRVGLSRRQLVYPLHARTFTRK